MANKVLLPDKFTPALQIYRRARRYGKVGKGDRFIYLETVRSWPITAGDNQLKIAKSCPLIPIPVYHATPTVAKRAIGSQALMVSPMTTLSRNTPSPTLFEVSQ